MTKKDDPALAKHRAALIRALNNLASETGKETAYERLGLSKGQFWEIVHGERLPNFGALCRIRAGLPHMTLDEICGFGAPSAVGAVDESAAADVAPGVSRDVARAIAILARYGGGTNGKRGRSRD